ncbi:uncharacterized protein [Haliotis asinina]|uniref:uncharacterized protein n=1 Tax=Haliotis asinina TaxID=109174 RepID=UPI00353230D3
MSVSALALVVFYLSISKLHDAQGENISNGKSARQSGTSSSYRASNALNKAYAYYGSVTNPSIPPWWEVDLRGYFIISKITVSAVSFANWEDAYVEVMDKNVVLCSDVQVVWCGAVTSTVAAGEKFTFTCNATFPVRFVRVTRSRGSQLVIGHVEVEGEGTIKPFRSYYKSSWNKKVSRPFLTTSVITAGDCGIVCHKHHSCIDFSYSATASTGENCLLTDKPLSLYYVNDNSWTTYSIYCM